MKIKNFILILLLVGCSGKAQEASNLNQNEFLELVSALPKVQIPFEVYCSKCCDLPKYDSSDERLLKKYLPEGGHLMGLISQNNKYVTILGIYPADMLIPVVITYDLKGVKIDEQTFMGEWCDREFGFLGKQYFQISTNLIFSEIDTSYTFKMDSLNYLILDTTDIKIERKNFTISENGKIKEQ